MLPYAVVIIFDIDIDITLLMPPLPPALPISLFLDDF